ncbi:hypothetical protein [Streptomyces sp. NPDC007264]|uniref:hypothetical protein n=1 Tax=Streptomyces sp. NPDC007264 TaxID=3364777 RepID=UPI0036DCC491
MSTSVFENEPVAKTVQTVGSGYSIVGRVWADDKAEWFPLSERTATAAIPAATEVLAGLGLSAGNVVCFVSRFCEVVQFAALERAAQAMGLVACHTEATPFDANRLAVYLEHLPVAAVIGLGAEILDNLEVELTSLLSSGTVVVARASAVERLTDLGVRTRRMEFVGPTVAMECDEHDGLHLDTSVWAYTADPDGRVTVAPADTRNAREAAVRTDIRGALVSEPCRCGRAGLRLVETPGPEREEGGSR